MPLAARGQLINTCHRCRSISSRSISSLTTWRPTTCLPLDGKLNWYDHIRFRKMIRSWWSIGNSFFFFLPQAAHEVANVITPDHHGEPNMIMHNKTHESDDGWTVCFGDVLVTAIRAISVHYRQLPELTCKPFASAISKPAFRDQNKPLTTRRASWTAYYTVSRDPCASGPPHIHKG